MNGIYPCPACDGDGFMYKRCGCRSADCPHESLMGDGTDPEPGMYLKFWVRRTDGSSRDDGKHAGCDYFVLDWDHDPFAVPAARAYAKACAAKFPQLAKDLTARANIEAKRWRDARRGGGR